MKTKTKKSLSHLTLHASFLLIALSPTPYTLGQQYGWTDISQNLPDYPFDTVIINNGADTVIAYISDISFINDNEGWVTTWHAFSDQNAAILHTTDGGTSWAFLGITGAPVTGMSFPPGSDTGYVCSYMSSNLQQITPELVNPISLGNSDWWNSVSAPSHELIWISGGNSVWTWDEEGLMDQPIASTFYNSIDFVQNNLGWGAGHDGVKEKNPGIISGCVGKNIPWVHLKYTEQPLYEVFALWVCFGRGECAAEVHADQWRRRAGRRGSREAGGRGGVSEPDAGAVQSSKLSYKVWS